MRGNVNKTSTHTYSDFFNRMITAVAEKMHAKVMNGMDSMDAWNAFSADLLQCAIVS